MNGYLKAYILTCGGRDAIAEKAGMSTTSLSRKLNGHTPFTVSEMWKIADATGMDIYDMVRAFKEDSDESVAVIQRGFSSVRDGVDSLGGGSSGARCDNSRAIRIVGSRQHHSSDRWNWR